MAEIRRVFRPNPGPQTRFWKSTARIIGYGGAFGGGKSRGICEKAIEYAMTCPGIQILIARQSHTSIVETTRKTFTEEVCPPELIAHEKHSMGEDFYDLYTPEPGVTSRVNFVGLEDPVRWYSAQIGVLIVDQVEECEEDTIVKLMTRLRHPKAPVEPYTGTLGVPAAELRALLADGRATVADEDELPDNDTALVRAHVVDYPLAGKAILSFNPENPGHWLEGWFILGSEKTAWGYRKPEMYATDADFPFGDAEFFFAKATDNPHLAPGYVAAQLAGLPAHLRRRYLDGIWEFITGNAFFDTAALAYYAEVAKETRPLIGSCRSKGDAHEDYLVRARGAKAKEPLGIDSRSGGPWTVWRKPVREHHDPAGNKRPAHRYVIAADVSSGRGADYSAIHVIDVDTFEQAAEFQAKLDPDQVALEMYRMGRIYNNAYAVPEVTGGWGFAVDQELKKLRYPNPYTKRVLDRLTRKWTDRTGWDTTMKSRVHMLSVLEQAIREQELGIYSLRTVSELGSFVWSEREKPEAQPGCHDDLVMALAIAVTVAVSMPRQLRRQREQPHQAQFAATGY